MALAAVSGFTLNCHPEIELSSSADQPPCKHLEETRLLRLQKFEDKVVRIEHGLRYGGTEINFNHGTTTLSFKYSGGIIVATDSRASAGSYIASGTVDKVLVVTDYILGTMAGGAADCAYWERVLAKQCRLFELRNKERMSVAAASKLLANMLYEYKNSGLSVGTTIVGWDKKGPGIYYVDNEGHRMAGDLFSVGSGSTYAYGILDGNYKYDLNDEQAYELARRAIFHAAHRDAASGGSVSLYHVKKEGWKFIGKYDIGELYYKYKLSKV